VCSPPGIEFDLYPEALEIRVAVSLHTLKSGPLCVSENKTP
jgi:hypothetical protein